MIAFPKPKPTRLTGKEYKAFRKKVHNRANGLCEDCGKLSPLYVESYGGNPCFDEFLCGHVSHIRSRGAGGPDTLENVKWRCFECHRANDDKWNYSENDFHTLSEEK